MFVSFLFFFFKQKTAYEMRISDWSSDVCSSDLRVIAFLAQNDVISAAGIDRVIAARAAAFLRQFRIIGADIGDRVLPVPVGAITRGITRFGVHAAFERLEYPPARSRRQVHAQVGGERTRQSAVAGKSVSKR